MDEQPTHAGFGREEHRSKDSIGLKKGKETTSSNTQSAHDIAREIALQHHKSK